MAEPSLMRVGSEKAVPQRPIPKATPGQQIVGTETMKKRGQIVNQLTPSINTSRNGDHWVTSHGRNFSARTKVIGRNEKSLNIVLLQGSINTTSTSGVVNISLIVCMSVYASGRGPTVEQKLKLTFASR
jgi:hypothetical protein